LAEGFLFELLTAFFYGMVLTFILMLFRVLLRRRWLAAAAFILLGVIFTSSGVRSASNLLTIAAGMSFFALFAATPLLFGGLLPTIVCLFVGNTVGSLPVADFSAWYASTTVFAVVVALALIAYAFHTALAGRPLFKARFLYTD
jgi:hypothetical protein